MAQHEISVAIIWPRFWVTQIWPAILFLVYCTYREFGRVLGHERTLRMFFGPGSPRSG